MSVPAFSPSLDDRRDAQLLADAATAHACAVAVLCAYFDQHGAVKTLGLLEDARQKLVIAMAIRAAINPVRDTVHDLSRHLNKARCGGARIGNIVDAVRAEFLASRRQGLNAQGWYG